MISLKALSALLTYPSAELQAAVPEIRAALHDEGLFGPHRLTALEPLLQHLAEDDIYDLQETYVLLFDRSRSLSLNLFEHLHGESRDRGGAMVSLLETYRDGGFDLIRVVTRNLSPALQEEPIDQWLMTGVEQMQFSFYDGTSWRTSWNSTNETTVLPRAIRVQIQMALPDASQLSQDRSVRITRSPIELVVPVLVTASTNTTQTASTP